MFHSLLKTGGFVSFLVSFGLILFADTASLARDLTKDDRWHTDLPEDEEYTGDVETGRRVGRRRTTDTRTDPGVQNVQPPQTTPEVLVQPGTQGQPATSAEGAELKIAPPSVEGPKGEEAPPDPKRDQLEAARALLEKQLERLRQAREAREKGAAGAVVAGEPKTSEKKEEAQPVLLRDVITLFVDPLEVRPEPGARFVSTVRLENHSRKEFDELGFTLRYNPKTLRVVDGDEELEGVNLFDRAFREGFPWERSQDYVNRVDPEHGLITYRARLREGAPLAGAGPVASVTFEVTGETGSDVGFLFWAPDPSGEVADGSPLTYVRLQQEDVLGRKGVPDDGTLDARVKFFEFTDEASGPEPVALADQDLLTRIVTYPGVDALSPGQEFDYIIELENPGRIEFDDLTLFLGYNQRYLMPLDHDRGNYITRGVNLFDGDSHEAFPFNHHRRNEIDPRRGIIIYRMGVLRTTLNGSGVIGSVRFRALAPTGDQGTRLKVGFLRGTIESGLTRRGADVLADPAEWQDGFEVYPVRVLPQGLSERD